MESKVLGLDGKPSGKLKLPKHFEEDFRPDLIKRAVLAEQSWTKQPKGVDPHAGMRSSAKFMGARRLYGHYYGYGIARIPKIRIEGRPVGDARNASSVRKGRNAHPPLVEKKLREEINKKERKKAIRCAISATAKKDVVLGRGHKFDGDVPVVMVNNFESVKKAKEVKDILSKLGMTAELERASVRKVRAGRGKMRGRKYKSRKGPLVVYAEDNGIAKACRNIPGIDVVSVDQLTAEALAPGAHPGRLTIWTESAVKKLEDLFR